MSEKIQSLASSLGELEDTQMTLLAENSELKAMANDLKSLVLRKVAGAVAESSHIVYTSSIDNPTTTASPCTAAQLRHSESPVGAGLDEKCELTISGILDATERAMAPRYVAHAFLGCITTSLTKENIVDTRLLALPPYTHRARRGHGAHGSINSANASINPITNTQKSTNQTHVRHTKDNNHNERNREGTAFSKPLSPLVRLSCPVVSCSIIKDKNKITALGSKDLNLSRFKDSVSR